MLFRSVDPELVRVMQGRAIQIAADFNSQGVANLMWALAKLGVVPRGELAGAMIGRAIEIEATFRPQGVANLMWACTCFDLSAIEATPVLFDRMAARSLHLNSSSNPADHFNEADLSQIGQWLLSCRIDASLKGRLTECLQVTDLKMEMGQACRAALPFSLEAAAGSRLQVCEIFLPASTGAANRRNNSRHASPSDGQWVAPMLAGKTISRTCKRLVFSLGGFHDPTCLKLLDCPHRVSRRHARDHCNTAEIGSRDTLRLYCAPLLLVMFCHRQCVSP